MKILNLLKQTINYLKKNPKDLLSPKKLFKNIRKFINRLNSKTNNSKFYNPLDKHEYNSWIKKEEDNKLEEKFKWYPLISILLPVYNVEKKYLEQCINSVLSQKYENYELCIVDDNSTNEDTLNCLKIYEHHPKIKISYSKTNKNISEATNRALKLATGDYIALLDNDDILDPYALSHVVYEINKSKHVDFIYTDEDKINEKNERFDPFFKPDWSPDTFLSYNYICHFVVVKKDLIDQVKGFRSKYDGCQDYDLILRITELTDSIKHIPKILYHWRAIKTSTAENIKNKDKIVEKTKLLLEETLNRRNIKANVEVTKENNYYIKYNLEKDYKISIIIPTKDHSELLKKCVDSILNKTKYKNYEIIIVNNNSIEPETYQLLNDYQKNEKINILNLECEFNYSYINNQAIKKATGDYVVLLNNDTEVLNEEWLTEMLRYAIQPHIGTVGVKLLYDDLTIQHGGVIIGLGGVAGHAFIGEDKNTNGPFSLLKITRNVGANTAACLMVEKKKYLEVKGLDENLKVAFNDVDFNLKLLEKNYKNIFLPNIELIHYESKSRGLEDTKEKIERFNSEVAYMKIKWKDFLKRDPYYNDNYSYLYNYKLEIK